MAVAIWLGLERDVVVAGITLACCGIEPYCRAITD